MHLLLRLICAFLYEWLEIKLQHDIANIGAHFQWENE